jgi:hypothetical protein
MSGYALQFQTLGRSKTSIDGNNYGPLMERLGESFFESRSFPYSVGAPRQQIDWHAFRAIPFRSACTTPSHDVMPALACRLPDKYANLKVSLIMA